MNTTDAPTVAPEVQEFLNAVRAELADLEPEEQREILDGLEADLTDLVAERGRGALGDPVDYARELRTAAGLEPQVTRRRARRRPGDALAGVMEAARQRTGLVVEMLPGDAPALLAWLRPLWWIVRAWVAVEVFDLLFGRGRYAGDLGVVPHMRGFGGAVLIVAIAVSIQLGHRKVWPGTSGSPWARLVLLLLNCLAVVMAPLVLLQLGNGNDDHPYSRGFDVGYREGQADARASDGPKKGLYLNGTWVSNIYPYDAKGRPLVGVQLFNQIGQPINVITQPEYQPQTSSCVIGVDGQCAAAEDGQPPARVYYPWTNGATQLLNVFPIPSRVQKDAALSPTAFSESPQPAVGPFPLASVPRVSLPGIKPGLLPAER